MWQCNRSTLNSVAQQSVSSCSLYSLRFSFLNIIMFFFLHFAVVRQWQWGWGWTGKQEERRENMQQTATGRPNPGHCSLAVQHVVTCKPTELKLFSVFFFQFQSKMFTLSSQEKASSAGQRGSPLNLRSPGLQILLPSLSQNSVSSRTDNFTASVVLWHAQKLMLV